MSVALPWSWKSSVTITVTKLQADGFGGTLVEGTFNDNEFSPFTLPKDVNIVGADALLNDIDFCVSEQVASAMRLAR